MTIKDIVINVSNLLWTDEVKKGWVNRSAFVVDISDASLVVEWLTPKGSFSHGHVSPIFLELFIDGWDHFMKSVRENERGVHIVMRPGEYLTDMLPCLEEERRADTTQPVAEETIRGIEEKLLELKKDLVLYLSGYGDSCLYPITDLDAPEERNFLCQIGREILDGGTDIAPVILPGCALRETLAEAYGTADREAVRAFVEGHRASGMPILRDTCT